jgi:hypothetical protein
MTTRFVFADFELIAQQQLLLQHGKTVVLGARAFELLLCLLQLTVTTSSLRGGRNFRVTGSYSRAVTSVAEITKLSGSFDHPKTVNALSNDRTGDKAPVVLGRIRRLILQAPAMLLLSISSYCCLDVPSSCRTQPCHS